MQEAYDDFAAEWYEVHQDNPAMCAALPSYDQVCYAMNKLPVVVKQRGRITGSEFRQYEGFVRRDWLSLPVNYAWIGDGHGMKMKVAHPDHGNPFSQKSPLSWTAVAALLWAGVWHFLKVWLLLLMRYATELKITENRTSIIQIMAAVKLTTRLMLISRGFTASWN